MGELESEQVMVRSDLEDHLSSPSIPYLENLGQDQCTFPIIL